jgi:ribosomal 50S subunit-recycling heat shock protein
VRLDVFLKKVGLARQRTLARRMCDQGFVRVAGRTAKAGKEIGPGSVVEIDSGTERIRIEVIGLPSRNYKRDGGRVFYDTIEHEFKDCCS